MFFHDRLTVHKSRIQKHHQQSLLFGLFAPKKCLLSDHNHLGACSCNVTAFLHNTAVLAFSLECDWFLRWETDSTDFPEY